MKQHGKENRGPNLAFALFISAILLLTAPAAHAQYRVGDFTKGSITLGYDSRTCDSTLEGGVRYHSTNACVELCDGSAWACAGGGGGGCTAPSSCPNVGDVCTDGSLFAGFVLYGTSCEALYVTDNNQSTATQWKTATGTNDINPDSSIDGRANHANRSGTLSNFPAFDLCESNTYHGKSDWYLPAEAELNVLQQNKAAINANAAGNFTSNFYWTSTETDSTYAWYVGFSLGRQDGEKKDDSTLDVRCVRRD